MDKLHPSAPTSTTSTQPTRRHFQNLARSSRNLLRSSIARPETTDCTWTARRMGSVERAPHIHQLRPDGVSGQVERMLCLLWGGDCYAVREMARIDVLCSMRGPLESARGGTKESGGKGGNNRASRTVSGYIRIHILGSLHDWSNLYTTTIETWLYWLRKESTVEVDEHDLSIVFFVPILC